MAENGDKSTKLESAQLIINAEVMSQVLEKDKGPEAKLLSWDVKSFTEKGDNYVCLVCAVKVIFAKSNEVFKTSYIAKLNPCVDVPLMESMFYEVFNKEGGFYFDLVPRLNEIFKSANLEYLKVPETHILNMEEDRECMFMEDLRQQGFKMHKRTVGLDVIHTTFALKELARLHASSMILYLQEPDKELFDRFSYLDNLLQSSEGMRHLFDMFIGFAYGLIDVADQLQGYAKVSSWIKKILTGLYERWTRDIWSNLKFLTVCHGDSWCNNMLFKYDDDGTLVDVRLLDLQLCNVGSLMQDIALFLFTSVNGLDRRNNLSCYLDCYFSSFSSIFAAVGKEMPFTREELEDEYNRMFTYGITMGIMNIPIVMESSDIPDFENGRQDSANQSDQIAPQRRQVMHSFKTNKLFRSRVLDIFNDIMIDNPNPIYCL